MIVKDYRELRVYQSAFEAAMIIYRASRKWPVEERYSLTDQVRRSSRSICSNIAEAWRKRRYPASFVSKLSDADAEAGETLTWLDFAQACEFISEKERKELIDQYEHICAQLVLMMNQSDKWCH